MSTFFFILISLPIHILAWFLVSYFISILVHKTKAALSIGNCIATGFLSWVFQILVVIALKLIL